MSNLIEITIVLAILAITYSAATPVFTHLLYTKQANATIQQIDQAILYARSLAIANQQKITLCPSYNRYSCGGNWQHGVLVVSPNHHARYFSVYLPKSAILLLNQSGVTNNRLIVQADGLTYTNGHFTYKSLKTSTQPQFKLYFNKALRTYRMNGT